MEKDLLDKVYDEFVKSLNEMSQEEFQDMMDKLDKEEEERSKKYIEYIGERYHDEQNEDCDKGSFMIGWLYGTKWASRHMIKHVDERISFIDGESDIDIL